MVERMAEAMASVTPGEISNDDLCGMAEAALRAMRKPTMGQIIAGGSEPSSIQSVWPKLIDEALTDRHNGAR